LHDAAPHRAQRGQPTSSKAKVSFAACATTSSPNGGHRTKYLTELQPGKCPFPQKQYAGSTPVSICHSVTWCTTHGQYTALFTVTNASPFHARQCQTPTPVHNRTTTHRTAKIEKLCMHHLQPVATTYSPTTTSAMLQPRPEQCCHICGPQANPEGWPSCTTTDFKGPSAAKPLNPPYKHQDGHTCAIGDSVGPPTPILEHFKTTQSLHLYT
jgi:hypothetical protein